MLRTSQLKTSFLRGAGPSDGGLDDLYYNRKDEEEKMERWGFSGFGVIEDESGMSLGGKSVRECAGSFFSDNEGTLKGMLNSIIGNRGGRRDCVSWIDVRESVSAGFYTIYELIWRYRENLDEEYKDLLNKKYKYVLDEERRKEEKEKKRKEGCILC